MTAILRVLCPLDASHVLGEVGREVLPPGGVGMWRETLRDENGLTREVRAGSTDTLVGRCRLCPPSTGPCVAQWGWNLVESLLDDAQLAGGVLTKVLA